MSEVLLFVSNGLLLEFTFCSTIVFPFVKAENFSTEKNIFRKSVRLKT